MMNESESKAIVNNLTREQVLGLLLADRRNLMNDTYKLDDSDQNSFSKLQSSTLSIGTKF